MNQTPLKIVLNSGMSDGPEGDSFRVFALAKRCRNPAERSDFWRRQSFCVHPVRAARTGALPLDPMGELCPSQCKKAATGAKAGWRRETARGAGDFDPGA